MSLIEYIYEWITTDILGDIPSVLILSADKMAIFLTWFIFLIVIACCLYLVEFVVSTISRLFPWA